MFLLLRRGGQRGKFPQQLAAMNLRGEKKSRNQFVSRQPQKTIPDRFGDKKLARENCWCCVEKEEIKGNQFWKIFFSGNLQERSSRGDNEMINVEIMSIFGLQH